MQQPQKQQQRSNDDDMSHRENKHQDDGTDFLRRKRLRLSDTMGPALQTSTTDSNTIKGSNNVNVASGTFPAATGGRLHHDKLEQKCQKLMVSNVI